MNGIYAAYYTGVAGTGYALFIMLDGLIAGSDVMGGLVDGTYCRGNDNDIHLSVTLTSPPGTSLVTGTVVGDEPLVQTIEKVLPDDLGSGHPIPVQTSTGPLNIVFRCLRTLP